MAYKQIEGGLTGTHLKGGPPDYNYMMYRQIETKWQYLTRHWATWFLPAVCSLLVIGCIATRPHTEVIADSVIGFSGIQGANGWSYGYWDRSADSDKNYDQESDFHLLKNFGGDPINRLSNHDQFTTGKLWNLDDGRFYTSLWASGGHPNGTMKLGDYAQVEQWAVRRWTSTITGPVTISGHAGKVMPWGLEWGGGVQAHIVIDGDALFHVEIEDGGKDYSISARVLIGSVVDFLIGPNPSVGVTEFTATIKSEPTIPR